MDSEPILEAVLPQSRSRPVVRSAGNLNHSCTEEDLLALFRQFGNVERVAICTDRDTGEPRGVGFIQLDSAENAQRAISQLNGRDCSIAP